jgi:hypothetical protein
VLGLSHMASPLVRNANILSCQQGLKCSAVDLEPEDARKI